MNVEKIKHVIEILKNLGVSSSLHILHNELRRRLSFSPDLKSLPNRLQIEISNTCNLDCEYCALKKYMPDKKIMLQDTFLKMIPYMKYMRGVFLSGLAEALVNKNTASFVKQIKKESKGVYVSIFTNASLLNESRSMELIESGLDSLVFSLDGVDPKVVDSIRKKGSLEQLIENIECLQNLKERIGKKTPLVSATMVMHKMNYEQLPQVVQLVKKLRIHRLNVNGLEPYYEHSIEDTVWNNTSLYSSVLDVLKESIKEARKLGIEFRAANLLPKSPKCYEVNTPIVLANGDVVPCSVLSYPRPGLFSVTRDNRLIRSEHSAQQVVFGNINDKSLPEIWSGAEYTEFRDKVNKKEFPAVCENCLIKHQFICVRSEWSPESVIADLENAIATSVL